MLRSRVTSRWGGGGKSVTFGRKRIRLFTLTLFSSKAEAFVSGVIFQVLTSKQSLGQWVVFILKNSSKACAPAGLCYAPISMPPLRAACIMRAACQCCSLHVTNASLLQAARGTPLFCFKARVHWRSFSGENVSDSDRL
jgi:hypothetical protein